MRDNLSLIVSNADAPSVIAALDKVSLAHSAAPHSYNKHLTTINLCITADMMADKELYDAHEDRKRKLDLGKSMPFDKANCLLALWFRNGIGQWENEKRKTLGITIDMREL